VDNEELDLELDKILPLLISADEEEDVVLDEAFLRFVDGIEPDSEPELDETAQIEPEVFNQDEKIEIEAQEDVSAQEPTLQPEPQMKNPDKKDVTHQKEGSLLLYLHDLVYFLAALMIASILFRVVVVSGDSMYNTLVDGDYLLIVSNVLYSDPKPGDVIVASKESFRGGESIVKRIIATEGQEVDIDFSTGTVYVDGEAIDEPYIYTATTNSEGMRFPLVVDEGCLFVMGDNRAMSMDSRDPAIGLIDCREVVGKAVFLIFPGNDGGTLDRKFDRIGGID